MLEIKEYVKAESLEQAFELNQKRTNQIIGGMLWMKMGDHRIQTAIDLSGLGLDTIEEDETQFSIGCMTSLRQLELHEGLNRQCGFPGGRSDRDRTGSSYPHRLRGDDSCLFRADPVQNHAHHV